ncbi:MAG: efflux RND transporter permease subunit [Acidiferrobacterales bacterium]
MSTLFFRNQRLLAVTILLVITAGLTALSTIPRQEDPTITNRRGTIVTPFPGASAERVEALITEKIEDELLEIPEIDTIDSESRSGVSVINIELLGSVVDNEEIFAQIRDALADAHAKFPKGVPAPVFDDDRGWAFTILAAFNWRLAGPPNLAIMGRYAEELQNRLRNVPGTEVVRLYGAPKEEIVVTIDPSRLASVGIATRDVANAISHADAKVSAGQLRSFGNDLLIEIAGELNGINRIRSVPVMTRPSGAILRVGDVADVRRSVVDPPEDLALLGQLPAVVVAARMENDRRVDLWSSNARAAIEAFGAQLPDGVALEVIFDQATYTNQRLRTLAVNLAIGAGLVVVVLFLTLGWRSALIVAASLPLTSLVTLAVLNFIGVPIHQMSVTGMIVAIGLLVDNAIVMVDAIKHRLAKGVAVLKAVRISVTHLRIPLLTSTLTTVLAFMPIVLLPGNVGEFVFAIGISVIISLISSYILSMTVIPALAGRLVRAESAVQTRWWRSGLSIPRLQRLFEASIDLSLRYPKLSLLAAGALPVLGFVTATTLTEQFFPSADRDQFHVELRLPSQASIRETEAVVLQAHELILRHDEIRSVNWFLGTSAPSFYYNLIMDQDGIANYAQAQVQTSAVKAATRIIPVIQRELDEAFPQAQILVRDLGQGPPFVAPLEMRIYGPDLDTLRRLGEQARAQMARVPTVTHTRTTIQGGEPKLWVHADEDAANLVGLSLVDIARQLDQGLEGVTGGSIVEGTQELPVRVRVNGYRRGKLSEIESLEFLPPSAAVINSGEDSPGIPLDVIGRLELSPAANAISRRNGERVNIVRGYLKLGTLPQEALEEFQSRLRTRPLPMPAGYRIEFGGESEKRNDAVSDLAAYAVVLVVLMIATVVLAFNSFRIAGLIFAVALQAMGLGLLSIKLLDYPLGFLVMMGLMGLVGLAINAAVVIVSALRANAQAVAGNPRVIREIVIGDTSRHIIATTITTFGGFLPLMLAGGGFWPPFAAAIAGGTLLSTIVSFYFVPASFLLITHHRPVLMVGYRGRSRDNGDEPGPAGRPQEHPDSGDTVAAQPQL